MVRIKLSKSEEIDSLMTAAKYQEFIQEKG